MAKATLQAAPLPLEMVKDAITLGNAGNHETYTGARAREVKKTLDQAVDSLDED